jgi:hypothetical protein
LEIHVPCTLYHITTCPSHHQHPKPNDNNDDNKGTTRHSTTLTPLISPKQKATPISFRPHPQATARKKKNLTFVPVKKSQTDRETHRKKKKIIFR